MSLNHWKLLSECRFQADLCHDFSQGILALMNVMWDNVRSLSDIEAGTHRKVRNVLGDEVETHVNVLRTGVQGNAVQILYHRVSLQEGWKMVNVTAIPEKVPRSEELQTVTLKSVLSKLETLASNCSGYVLRAMWAMKTVAEAITEALVTSLEALGRQIPGHRRGGGYQNAVFFSSSIWVRAPSRQGYLCSLHLERHLDTTSVGLEQDGASGAVVEGRRRTAAEGWRQQPHPQAEFVAVIVPELLGEELVEELQVLIAKSNCYFTSCPPSTSSLGPPF
ncbi:uncharacterized protein LOC115333986 [Aquila chrysaetos chrysaetos]|uniref:uncharacterized protein LOC115333986 n=1 Tax=Aquila chrysaetos chrysaetos TaxID=223781 RepID=UPI0011771A1E|nr:uncharacterized protein LOC115333986 [Aquila chrysaetos chrysaetos]